jgi:hypothetical protein
VLTRSANANATFVAFSVERNSGIDLGDLAELTAFVGVADLLSLRAAASRIGMTPSALNLTKVAEAGTLSL